MLIEFKILEVLILMTYRKTCYNLNLEKNKYYQKISNIVLIKIITLQPMAMAWLYIPT